MCQALRQVLGAKWEWSREYKPSGPPQFATPCKGPARRQKAPSQDTGRTKIGLPAYPAASRTRDPYHPGPLPGLALTLRRSCSGPPTPWNPGPQFPHPATLPPQLEKNHVAPPSSQDEALGRYSVSREVPCSALKGDPFPLWKGRESRVKQHQLQPILIARPFSFS